MPDLDENAVHAFIVWLHVKHSAEPFFMKTETLTGYIVEFVHETENRLRDHYGCDD